MKNILRSIDISNVNWGTSLKEYSLSVIGLAIFVFGWTAFLVPHGIVGGGVSGIGAIVQFATNGLIPIAYTYFVLNIVLLTIGFIVLGGGFGFKTIFCIVVSSIFFKIFPDLWASDVDNKLLNAIIGAILEAVGIGMVFLQGGSTGGVDIIVLIIAKYRSISIGRGFLIMDALVVSSLALLPDKSFNDVVYGYVDMVVFALMIDVVQNGVRQSVQILAFSKNSEKIADRLSDELERGVTMVKTSGWYSKKENNAVMCVVRKTEQTKAIHIIKDIDPEAFYTITPTAAVYGLGFDTSYYKHLENNKK
ncbi:MAG: YitT family protein [Bacteroidales bacterium]